MAKSTFRRDECTGDVSTIAAGPRSKRLGSQIPTVGCILDMLFSHWNSIDDQKFLAAFLAPGTQQEGVVREGAVSDLPITVRALHKIGVYSAFGVRSELSRRAAGF